MPGSAILDVAIGLVFVYLMFSLVVMAVNRLIETLLKWRASYLTAGIRKLLGAKKAEEFFAVPLIKSLRPNSFITTDDRKPSYIQSDLFAEAMLELLAPAAVGLGRKTEDVGEGIKRLTDEGLKKTLTMLFVAANQDQAAFKKKLEEWFDKQMERVSGWFKRYILVQTILVALVVTILLNVDTIEIVKRLSTDAALRNVLVGQAQEVAKRPQPGAPEKKADGKANDDKTKEEDKKKSDKANTSSDDAKEIAEIVEKIKKTGLPIGWNKEAPDWKWFEMISGWVLTTMAISIGAPFWFDLLNKLIALRPATKPKSPDNPQGT